MAEGCRADARAPTCREWAEAGHSFEWEVRCGSVRERRFLVLVQVASVAC